jgi:hypothetical protein
VLVPESNGPKADPADRTPSTPARAFASASVREGAAHRIEHVLLLLTTAFVAYMSRPPFWRIQTGAKPDGGLSSLTFH